MHSIRKCVKKLLITTVITVCGLDKSEVNKISNDFGTSDQKCISTHVICSEISSITSNISLADRLHHIICIAS